MSYTPRTDAITSPETDNRLYLSLMIEHARQLELELAEAKDLAWRRVLQLDDMEKQRDDLIAEVSRLREAL